VANIEPANPALHVQPMGTFAPLLLIGQFTAEQPDVCELVTVPEKPALQMQPAGRELPALFVGHGNAVQVET